MPGMQLSFCAYLLFLLFFLLMVMSNPLDDTRHQVQCALLVPILRETRRAAHSRPLGPPGPTATGLLSHRAWNKQCTVMHPRQFAKFGKSVVSIDDFLRIVEGGEVRTRCASLCPPHTHTHGYRR